MISSLFNQFAALGEKDVRKFCESAMALIEEKKRTVSVTKCTLVTLEKNVYTFNIVAYTFVYGDFLPEKKILQF